MGLYSLPDLMAPDAREKAAALRERLAQPMRPAEARAWVLEAIARGLDPHLAPRLDGTEPLFMRPPAFAGDYMCLPNDPQPVKDCLRVMGRVKRVQWADEWGDGPGEAA